MPFGSVRKSQPPPFQDQVTIGRSEHNGAGRSLQWFAVAGETCRPRTLRCEPIGESVTELGVQVQDEEYGYPHIDREIAKHLDGGSRTSGRGADREQLCRDAWGRRRCPIEASWNMAV